MLAWLELVNSAITSTCFTNTTLSTYSLIVLDTFVYNGNLLLSILMKQEFDVYGLML